MSSNVYERAMADREFRCQAANKVEKHEELSGSNGTQGSAAIEKCVHELFEQQVERAPEATAVVFKQQRLSYRELNERANQVAHHLRTLGVVPGSLVAICAERSLEMATGLLGILKAGGAYLPMDPAYPRERLEFMLKDAGVALLLTQQKLLQELGPASLSSASALTVVLLDSDWQMIGRQSRENPTAESHPDHSAYVIYTSGSTGRPKGVSIPHSAVVNHNLAVAQLFDLSCRDRVAQCSSLSFDIAVEELFPTWVSGATVVLYPTPFCSPGSEFSRWAEEEQITVLDLPTAFWHAWVADLVKFPKALPSNVRLIVVGGEKASPKALAQWQRIAEDRIRWINAYGPTETTVGSLFYEAKPGEFIGDNHRDVPIGRPIANTSAVILDPDLRPVPVGEPGELCISGAGLARGYLNRPELTAEKFIASPFSPQASGRLYRTGDMARCLPDGNFEFLGRFDDQVKIRGFRVELGEIEAVLNTYPAVQQCVVVAQEAPGADRLGKRLVAYIVPWRQPAPLSAELRIFLKHKLPEYMVPAVFVALENLPLTPNGKVDRRALPLPEHVPSERNGHFVAPRTAVEELLAGIWSDVLGVESVGINENFMDLGGHSLLATQVVSRIGESLKIELPLRTLFEAHDLAELAEHIDKILGTGKPLRPSPIPAVALQKAALLSFSQERLWFLHQLEPNTSTYNSSAAIRCKGSLDAGKLERSLNEIIRRHEVLRTAFEIIQDQPVQVVVPEASLKLLVIDLHDEIDSEARAQRLIAEHMRRPFDLTRVPVLRAALFKVTQAESILLLTIHHIASDGWSFGILFRELALLYNASDDPCAAPLPALTIQYRHFAAWQREQVEREFSAVQLAYWKRQLGNLPVLELPTDYPRAPVLSYRGALHPVRLSQSTTERLKTLSRREGVTLFMTLLAAFKVLLYRYTRQEDVVVASPVANRNRTEFEELIGCFFNTLVLRTDLSGNPSFRELLTRVREVCLTAYAHQDLPIEKLLEELRPARDLSRNPLFQVMLILHNTPVGNLDFSGLQAELFEIERESANFDLTLSLTESAEGLTGSLEYSADLFEHSTIARMVEHFTVLLEGIIADSDRPIATLPLLSASERRQQLLEWNDTKTEYPKDHCIHQLFEAQAERAPESTALVLGGRRLSYGELNRRANQLAHYLQELGVRRNSLVAISLERSIEMVVAIYAVLKAGCAYVPLDPNYPIDRLDYMLKNADAPVLLTQTRFFPRWRQSSTKIVCVDSAWLELERYNDQNPGPPPAPDDLIYVIYTSGSTGRPKGAAVYHRGFMNLLHWFTNAFSIAATDRVLLMSSLSFDLTQKNIYAPLIRGGQLHLLPDSAYDPGKIASIIDEQRITLLNCTPSGFYPLFEHDPARSYEKLGSLRAVFLGGEPISVPRLEPWLQSGGRDSQIVNTYGPTECTDICTYYGLNLETVHKLSFVPIGRPIDNSQVLVLNKDLGLCPTGAAGELCVAGHGLGAGYVKDPDLTARKFVANPFPEISSEKIYRTNDLVRYSRDGNIEFLGRLDHQVKVRGFRVELGEVETVLNQHPGVREATVIVREDTPDDRRLVAYVVPERQFASMKTELQSHLRNLLPEYMVPSAFVALERLPLTPNGKVDRLALPKPDPSPPGSGENYVAPKTSTEKLLVRIWSKVLKVKRIGTADNFFDLGGHSLLAVRLMHQIETSLGKKLPLAVLFQAPTIAEFTAVLREDTAAALSRWSSLYAIQPHGAKPPFFWVHGEHSDNFLPRYLAPDQPLYGLRHQSEDGRPARYKTVAEIASHYLREIRQVRPHGPYLLGGYCFGAIVSFEIAQQLRKLGETVELLVFLNPATPAHVKTFTAAAAPAILRPLRRVSLSGEISRHVANLRALNMRQRASYLFERILGKAVQFSTPAATAIKWKWNSLLHKKSHRLIYKLCLAAAYPIPARFRKRHILDVYERAIDEYRPEAYPGRLLIFKAANEYDPSAWEPLAMQGTQVYEIPGGHSDVLTEPYLRNWAELLRGHIEKGRTQAAAKTEGERILRFSKRSDFCAIPLALCCALLDSLAGPLTAVL